jgi:lipopolysaccharide/colanic/teichoic acid biosynthesis glycosyltransferase
MDRHGEEGKSLEYQKNILTEEEYQSILTCFQKKKTTLWLKRIIDFLMSLIFIVVLSPLIIVISIWILIDSGLPILFRQERMGEKGRVFKIYKFRTMKNNTGTADGITLLQDKRITKLGTILRKYRLDEIPQLLNVIKGEMSFVGFRPDLPQYYKTDELAYQCVLLVKPGITSEATIIFKDEMQILSASDDPERTYTEEIFPEKIRINVDYIKKISLLYDFKIMIKTVTSVFVRKR